jgi:hypothetical protein
MVTPSLNWRVLVRDDAPDGARPAPGAQRSSVIVMLGLCAGALATVLANALSARTAPLALLLVLLSTLLAGRLAPLGPALAHGAGAWMVMAVAGVLTYRGSSAWHGIPAVWSVLLLIENMALIGRVGYVHQRNVRQRSERGG